MNDNIKHVTSYKYLGFILDNGLSFKLQIQLTINKILHKLYILSKTRQYLTEKTAIVIYKSMILPYFDYGDIIYMFSSKNDLEKLERLQERCIHICTRTYGRINIDNTRKANKIPTLEKRRNCNLNNFMYKKRDNIEIIDDDDNLIMTRSRTNKKFIVHKPNLESYKRSIVYSGAKCWNSLPNESKNIDIYEIFKFHQKKKMLEFK